MTPPLSSYGDGDDDGGGGGGSQQRNSAGGPADVVFWPMGRWGRCSVYRHRPAIVISAVSVILISCTRPPCPYRLRTNKNDNKFNLNRLPRHLVHKATSALTMHYARGSDTRQQLHNQAKRVNSTHVYLSAPTSFLITPTYTPLHVR